jgi:hypothetical protein
MSIEYVLLPLLPSTWKLLARRLNPLSRSLELPNALQIVMLTKELAAHRIHTQELAATPIALHLTPPLEQYGILDFRAALPLIEVGYRYTASVLETVDLGELLDPGDTDGPPPAGEPSEPASVV